MANDFEPAPGNRMSSVQLGKRGRRALQTVAAVLRRTVRRIRRGGASRAGRLFVFIAYAPPGYEGDLGRAYNDYMERLDPEDWALFIDHDAMLPDQHWRQLVTPILARLASEAVLVVARTNRIGSPYQRLSLLEDEHRLSVHAAFARFLRERESDATVDVTHLPPASGVLMLLRRSTWERTRFPHGFLAVDNDFHRSLRARGGRILLPLGLYAYHFYRADGDASHAVVLPRTPPRPAAPHRVRTFVHEAGSGLRVADYLDMLPRRGWAILLGGRTMPCDRGWYDRACAIAAAAGSRDVIILNGNRLAPGPGGADDILAHRRIADRLAGEHGAATVTLADVLPVHLQAFMLSRDLLAALGGSHSLDPLALADSLRSRRAVFRQAHGIYVYSYEEGEKPPAEDAREGRLAFESFRAGSRRIAILMAWPQQTGMDMILHEIAEQLTASGDLVTLFSPHPETSYTAVKHSYLLRRHRSPDEFAAQFAAHHKAFPFDAILASGPGETAGMGLAMKRRHGIPFTLRLSERSFAEAGTAHLAAAPHLSELDRVIVGGPESARLVADLNPSTDIRVVPEDVAFEELGKRYRSALAGL